LVPLGAELLLTLDLGISGSGTPLTPDIASSKVPPHDSERKCVASAEC